METKNSILEILEEIVNDYNQKSKLEAYMRTNRKNIGSDRIYIEINGALIYLSKYMRKLANSINVNLESELVIKKPEFEKEYSFLEYSIVKENN